MWTLVWTLMWTHSDERPEYRLPNLCLGVRPDGSKEICARNCQVGHRYTCGDTGSDCVCYDMDVGCGSNVSLPAYLKSQDMCSSRSSGDGELCGWCAATSACSTRSGCPETPPAPPLPPPPFPPPRPYVCASLRPQCNVCGGCCNGHFDNASCAACVKDVCHPPPPPVPCANSTYNVTPAPGVLSGPCTCTLSYVDWPEPALAFSFSSPRHYTDNEHCAMQLPLNGSMDAPPFFYTEYAHDVVTFNGVNYSGVSGEIGGWPRDPVRVHDSMMYWRSDEKIVGDGWDLEFRIPLPRV